MRILLYLQQHKVTLYSNKYSLQAAQDPDMISEFSEEGKQASKDVEFDHVIIFNDTEHKIHRVVTMGGDGTILYAIKMFYNRRMPPIISFSMGSLGFL